MIRGAGGFNGPGKLTEALEIDKRLNGKIASPVSGLWFEDRGFRPKRGQVKKLPRVGVHYAGEVWANKPYRFALLKKNKKTSRTFLRKVRPKRD